MTTDKTTASQNRFLMCGYNNGGLDNNQTTFLIQHTKSCSSMYAEGEMHKSLDVDQYQRSHDLRVSDIINI